MEEIIVNGIKYVPKTSEGIDDMRFCIVCTYCSGAYMGYVKYLNGKEVVIIDAYPITFLGSKYNLNSHLNVFHEMAIYGWTNIDFCRDEIIIPEIILVDAVKIIPCTEYAKNNLLATTKMIIK